MALLRDQKFKEALTQWSSFVTVEKTLEEVVSKCLHNERLKRLLYYTDKHALSLPKLTQAQSASLIGEAIQIVPKLKTDHDIKPYIIISLDNFMPAANQTTFRQITLAIDVFCNYDHWILADFKLRPWSIAGELDAMINNSYLSAGIADFYQAKQLVLNEHIGGCTLLYRIESFLDDMEPVKPRSDVIADNEQPHYYEG